MWQHAVIIALSIAVAILICYVIVSKKRDSRDSKEAEKDPMVEDKLASEKRIQALMDACPLATSLFDHEGKELYCNKLALEIFGVDDTYDFSKSVASYLSETQPDGRNRDDIFKKLLEDVTKNGVYKDRLMYQKIDGTPIPLDTTCVRLDYGDHYIIAEFYRDLTEEIAAQEKEREINELNELFMQHSPLIMNIWDDAEKLVSTSPHAVEMFELESMEQYLEQFFDLSPELQPCGTPSREKAKMYNERAFKEGYIRFEWMHQKLNGEPIPTEIITHCFTRHGKPFLATFAIDLRSAITIQEKEINKRMRLMVDFSPLLIEYWNQDCRSLDCNKAVMEFYGFTTKDEYTDYLRKGEISREINGYDGIAHRDKWNAHIIQIFEEGHGRFEWSEPMPGGAFRTLDVEGVRTMFNNNPVVITYSRDVTEIKRLEIEKDELLEKFKVASEAKSRFLANMSHEIRTPMSAIIGMTGIAIHADDIVKKDDSLGKIEKASRHLLGVLNQILDISKIEAGQFTLSSHTFQLDKMVDEVLNILDISINEKQLTLEVKLDENLPRYIVSDEVRLAQVFTNLMNNAIKFTPEGGKVSLNVGFAHGDISTMLVEVSDTGIGIDPEQQSYLFGDFSQLESGVSRKFGGTGLGLSISKRIIEMMGGSIWIKPKQHEGSTFVFAIPLEVGSEHDEDSHTIFSGSWPKDVNPNLYEGYTILFAEDVDINHEILGTMLEQVGITMEAAMDGMQAVNMFRDNPERYDMILMDVQMPDMDGLTATRLIRELDVAKARSIPIVALTANVFQEDIDRCIEAGMNDHLGKPFDWVQIMEKLEKYLKV